MRLSHTFITLCLFAALFGCSAAPDENAAVRLEPASATPADPMAGFARLLPGEWRVRAGSAASLYGAWSWGPGEHSVRQMIDGTVADDEPWRELTVIYWHPGRKQVCLWSVNPFARSVSEGTISFAGDTADAVIDLYQTGSHRHMGLHWIFDGPDQYHETLLEATGPDGLQPLAEWDHFRSMDPPAPRPRSAEEAPKPSAHLQVIVPFLGHTWQTRGDSAIGEESTIQTGFEYIPYADAVCMRTMALTEGDEPTHLLDAYIYHHTGTGRLRCLALTNSGGVYEGDLTVQEGGSLKLDLEGYDDTKIVPCVVQFDFEGEDTLRQRLWFLEGGERTLILDLTHKVREPESN